MTQNAQATQEQFQQFQEASRQIQQIDLLDPLLETVRDKLSPRSTENGKQALPQASQQASQQVSQLAKWSPGRASGIEHKPPVSRPHSVNSSSRTSKQTSQKPKLNAGAQKASNATPRGAKKHTSIASDALAIKQLKFEPEAIQDGVDSSEESERRDMFPEATSARKSLACVAAETLLEIAGTAMRRSVAAQKFSRLAGVPDPTLARPPERARGGVKLGDLRGSDPESFLEKRGCQEGDKARIPQDKEILAVVEQFFFDSMPQEFVKLERIEQVIDPHLLRRFMKSVSQETGSIEATFHGTPVKFAGSIMKDGLLKELETDAAYGRGAYVGAHAGVAHQFADPEKDGRRCMCIVLVKFVQESQVVAAERLMNPAAYYFVHESRVLVSHLITYRESRGTRKRNPIGHDPFERKLNEAILKASRDRQSSAIM